MKADDDYSVRILTRRQMQERKRRLKNQGLYHAPRAGMKADMGSGFLARILQLRALLVVFGFAAFLVLAVVKSCANR